MPRMALGILVAALVLVCGITLWTRLGRAYASNYYRPGAVSRQRTQHVSFTRVVDGDTIEVSPQVEGTTDGYASSAWIPPRYPGEKNPAAPRPPPSIQSNSKVKT
jgi:hypothetical protein